MRRRRKKRTTGSGLRRRGKGERRTRRRRGRIARRGIRGRGRIRAKVRLLEVRTLVLVEAQRLFLRGWRRSLVGNWVFRDQRARMKRIRSSQARALVWRRWSRRAGLRFMMMTRRLL